MATSFYFGLTLLSSFHLCDCSTESLLSRWIVCLCGSTLTLISSTLFLDSWVFSCLDSWTLILQSCFWQMFNSCSDTLLSFICNVPAHRLRPKCFTGCLVLCFTSLPLHPSPASLSSALRGSNLNQTHLISPMNHRFSSTFTYLCFLCYLGDYIRSKSSSHLGPPGFYKQSLHLQWILTDFKNKFLLPDL